MPRYKLVVQVVIGEIKGQGLRVMSKCLWDDQFDNYATYTYKDVRNVIPPLCQFQKSKYCDEIIT